MIDRERPEPDPSEEDKPKPDQGNDAEGSTVEEESEDSFPASDPPSW